jgi:hypothetical protein
VVIEDGILTYSTKKGSPPKATINLSTISFEAHPKKNLAISIELSNGHHFFLKSEKIEDKEQWLKALKVGQETAKSTSEVVVNDNMVGIAKRGRKNTQMPKKPSKMIKEENDDSEDIDDERFDIVEKGNENGQNLAKSANWVDNTESMFNQQHVFNKDEILEGISTILYKTQILANDSPVTNSLIAIEANTASIYKDLNEVIITDPENKVTEEYQQKIINNVVGNVGDMRLQIEKLIHTFEDIREQLYPIAEKIALIELQKNPYRIPGDPYQKMQLDHKTVSILLLFISK